MLDLDTILKKRRMPHSEGDPDGMIHGKRVNRLFGLNDLIKENLKLDSIICELGAHVGVSTSLFAYYCKLVYSVDVWTTIGVDYIPAFESEFDAYMVNFHNVVKIKDTSVNASYRFMDGYLDAVYVDADHSYEAVKKDIKYWKPKIKKGGFIAGHDYFIELADTDVTKAVIEVFGEPDKVYEDSSWLKRL